MTDMIDYYGDTKCHNLTTLLNSRDSHGPTIRRKMKHALIFFAFDVKGEQAIAYKPIQDATKDVKATAAQFGWDLIASLPAANMVEIDRSSGRKEIPRIAEVELPEALGEHNASFSAAQKIVGLIEKIYEHKCKEIPADKETYDIWLAKIRARQEIEAHPEILGIARRPGTVAAPPRSTTPVVA